jgi:hypothetical protein
VELNVAVREQWDGGEWQVHCCTLLGIKHGEDIQFVPDRVRGDGGMEAYRVDDGVVYQCYAPEDAFTISTQTEAQKGKIREDVAKLVGKPAETMALLGDGYKIRRWVLLTPQYDDKELIKYARTKSKRVRDEDPRPPWCHDDFQIMVYNDRELFPAQLAVLNGMGNGDIRIQVEEPPASEIELHGRPLEQKLRAKLLKHPQLASDADQLDGFCEATLYDYVYGKKQLEILQGRYGLAYELLARRARATFRTLRRPSLDGSSPEIADLEERLSASFKQDVPSLSQIACDEIARHYISSWLIECPLRLNGAAA